VDHAVVPVIDNIRSAKECITKYREVIGKGTQDAEVRVRNMPNEVIVRHIDDFGAKREVKGTPLARIQAVDHIQIGVCDIVGRRKGRDKVLHDGCGQGAESISAVQQESLTFATVGRAVNGDNVTVWLVDRDTVEVDPEPGEAVG
jgi:hypothetical protein